MYLWVCTYVAHVKYRYNNHVLTDEEALCAHQLAQILSPVKTLIATLEASSYPTSNLVKPYVGKMIDRLSPDKGTHTTYRDVKEHIKVMFCHAIFCNALIACVHFM